MSNSQPSDFPKHKDGDVTLLVSTTRMYQLHSSVLRRNSPYFKQSLDAQLPPKLTAAARRDGLTPYRFELVKHCEGDVGFFARKHVLESGRSERPNVLLPNLDNGKVANESYKYWDMLFGSFYNRQPEFNDHNLATVLSGCMGLVDVAESVGAVDQVREFIDLALLRQDKTLWASIATSPIPWTQLGRRVHSPMIFTEAICHLVGRWQTVSQEEKTELNPEIVDLCQHKFKELDTAKEAIEMRILGHYPHFLTRTAASKPGRPTYANDIYMWMALSFFRQWFAQAISDGRNRTSCDGGYKFYNQIATAGQAYLDHETFRNFHMYFPMSSKACTVLEAHMGVLKEDVKSFVSDICKEHSHVKSENFPLAWLTCTVVQKEDFPWTAPEEEQDESMVVNGSFDDGEDLSPTVLPMPYRPNKPKKSKTNGF